MKEYKEVDKSDNQNITLYLFSVYSLIKKTIQNIDLNFAPIKTDELNFISFQNRADLVQQIEQFGQPSGELAKSKYNSTGQNKQMGHGCS